MKYCPRCKKALNDNDTFCSVCGTRVDNSESNNQQISSHNPQPKTEPFSKVIALLMEILYLPIFFVLVGLNWSNRIFSSQFSSRANSGITPMGMGIIFVWNILWCIGIFLLLSNAKEKSGQKNSPINYILTIFFLVVVLIGMLIFSSGI